jgi:hypothetical protein
VLPLFPLHLFRIYFGLGYGVFQPAHFVTMLGPIRMSSRAMVEGSFAALIYGVTFLLAGVLFTPLARRFAPDVSKLLDRKAEYTSEDTVSTRLVALPLIAVNVFLNLVVFGQAKILGPFYLTAVLISGQEIILGLLFWDAFKTRSPVSRLLVWFGVVTLSLGGMSTGMLGAAVAPWITMMLLLWTLERRVPFGLITASVLTVLVLNPAKPTYRRLAWSSGAASMSQLTMFDRASLWGDALYLTYSGHAPETEAAMTGALDRMSTLVQVIHIFEWVPHRLPHEGPEAWLDLPLYLVPSLFWPQRPSAVVLNKEYMITFRLLDERMTRGMAITVPAVGDGFWRLGWFGVALEGVVLGVVAAFFFGMARPSSRALTILALGFMLGVGPESAVLPLLAGLPKGVLVEIGMLLFVQWLPAVLSVPRRSIGPPQRLRPDA